MREMKDAAWQVALWNISPKCYAPKISRLQQDWEKGENGSYEERCYVEGTGNSSWASDFEDDGFQGTFERTLDPVEWIITLLAYGIFALGILLLSFEVFTYGPWWRNDRFGCCPRRMIKVKNQRHVVRIVRKETPRMKMKLFLFYLILFGEIGGGIGKRNSDHEMAEITGHLTNEKGIDRKEGILPENFHNHCTVASSGGPHIKQEVSNFGNENEIDRINAINTAIPHTWIDREGDLHAELLGLQGQNEEGEIQMVTYGLRYYDRGKRSFQPDLEGAETEWNLAHQIRSLWSDELRMQERIEIYLIDPQIPDFLTAGREEIHLIVDLKPSLGKRPVLVLNLLRQHGLEGQGYEARTARLDANVPCNELFKVNTFPQMCLQQHVVCRCDLMNAWLFEIEPQDLIETRKGMRIDILTEVNLDEMFLSEGSEVEETNMMQLSRGRRARSMMHYVYWPGVNEPTYMQRHDDEPGTVEEFIEERYHRGHPFAGALETKLIETQPEDLATRQIDGYMVIELRRTPRGKVGILLDIQFYVNNRPTPATGPAPNEEWRECLWLPARMNRNELLKEINMEQFCLGKEDRCLVYHRGMYWNSMDRSPRHLQHGDYIIVKALQRNTEVELQYQWQCAEQGRSIDEAEELRNEGLRRMIRRRRVPRRERDETSLLQHKMEKRKKNNITSFTTFARERLPPPGNGVSSVRNPKVTFDEVVEVWDVAGRCEKWKDLAISNEFVNQTCQRNEAEENNGIYERFTRGMRYQKIDEDDPENLQSGHENETRYLQLKRFDTQEETLDGDGKDGGESQEKVILPISEHDTTEYHQDEGGEGRIKRNKNERINEFMDWLESLQVLPNYERSQVSWKKASMRWVNSPLWLLKEAQEMSFFVDGSQRGKDLTSGITLYIKSDDTWYFGGFIGYHFGECDQQMGIYEAELQAHSMAYKWIFDEVRLQRYNYGCTPKVNLCYDSNSAGKAAAGEWGGNPDNHFLKTARGLRQWLNEGLQVKIDDRHQHSHRGHPGNEAADDVANWAFSQPAQEAPWKRLCEKSTAEVAPWMWWMAKNHGTDERIDLQCIPKPKARINHHVLKEMEVESDMKEVEKIKEIDASILTYNINSINENADKKKQKVKFSPTKMAALLQLYEEQGIDIFMWQETRMQKKVAQNTNFMIFQTYANQKGNGGIMIGLRKKRRKGGGHQVQEKNVKIIHADEEMLILRVQDPTLKAVLVSGHAPHSGRRLQDIKEWWQRMRKMLRDKAEGWPVIFGIDTNGRVGSIESRCISSYQGSQETEGGAQMHQLCIEAEVICPSTFEKMQIGPGETWRHPGGKSSRIDYIGIPMSWASCTITARVAQEMACTQHLYDHSPAIVKVEGRCWTKCIEEDKGKLTKKVPRIDYSCKNIQKAIGEKLEKIEAPSWEMDVHSHLQIIHEGIRRAVEEVAEEHTAINRRKQHLSEETWGLIQKKRQLRGNFFTWRDIGRKITKKMVFLSWKRENEEAEELRMRKKEAAWKEAVNHKEFQSIGKEVTKRTRIEDEAFFKGFGDALERFDTPKHQRDLWKELKRYLPRHKKMRETMKAENLDATTNLWSKHLCTLEAGEEVTFEEIYNRCIDDQNHARGEGVTLEEIPTLIDLEAACRASKINKAAGVDQISGDLLHYLPQQMAGIIWPLMVKVATWKTEPIQMKGGEVRWLHKKGAWDNAQNYRGILLASSIGKRLHSLYRQPLMAHLDKVKGIGQIGGVKNQETIYGNHFIRSLIRTSHSAGLVSVVIFVDLSAAFHNLIREILVGIEEGREAEPSQEHALKVLTENLEKKGNDVKEIFEDVKKGGYLGKINTPPRLQELVKEFGLNSWSLVGQKFVQTYMGSRPGTPLADVLFHFLMNSTNEEVQKAIQEEEESEELCQSLGFSNFPVIWADDMAYGLLARENSDILESAARVTRKVKDSFEKKGLQLNFSHQKTEALVSHRGRQASRYRREWLNKEVEVCKLSDEKETKQVEMGLTAAYRHLGCYHSAGGKMEYELNHRIGQTWSMWRTLQTSLFRTRRLSKRTKLRLAHSLLLTRLLHGAESWPMLTTKQISRTRKCYMHILRGAVGELYRPDKPEAFKAEVDFLNEYDLLPVEYQVSMKRLLYAGRMEKHGKQMMYQILEAEEGQRKDSWLGALRKDLVWLTEVAGKEWGDDLQSYRLSWGQRQGWKSFVKRAMNKHLAQEKIARKIYQLNLKGQEKSIDLTGENECHCGRTFQTKTGLAVHQRKEHGKHSDTYWISRGSICYTCMRQFWRRERLQMHFEYIPKAQNNNVCHMYQNTFFETVTIDEEEDTEKPEFNLPGIGRREALRLAGPLQLGIAKKDVEWARDTFDEARKKLEEVIGTDDPDSLRNQTLHEELEMLYGNACAEDLGPLVLLLEEQIGKSTVTVTTFFLWGARRTWEKKDLKEDWCEIVNSFQEGPVLSAWHESQQNVLRCEWLRNSGETRTKVGKPAKTGKTPQNTELRRTIVEIGDSLVFPFLLNGKYWTKKQLEALSRPECTGGALRKLL